MFTFFVYVHYSVQLHVQQTIRSAPDPKIINWNKYLFFIIEH